MTRRRLPARLRIVIGIVALPALVWSTPLVAAAQAGPAAPPRHVAGQPHDPEAEDDDHSSSSSTAHANDDDDEGNDDCDDVHEGHDDERDDDDCGPAPVVGEAPLAVGLPIAGAGVVGAVILFRRRRPGAVN